MKMMKITKRKDEKTDQQLTPQQEEALAKKEIEQYRRETSEQLSRYEEEQKRKEESGEEKIDVKERLSYVFGKKQGKKEESIDFNKREDEALIEKPLPYTMASEDIPIDYIHDGVIKTEDNRYVSIIEVMPINFLLKGLEEQESIVDDFQKFLRIGPAVMQFKSLAKRTDISRYLAKIREDMRTETNERCKKLQADYAELIKNIGTYNSVTRRFFIIWEYSKNSYRHTKEEDIIADMNNLRQKISGYVSACGNTTLIMNDKTEDMVRILYDILNRFGNSSVDLRKRIQTIYNFYDEHYGEKATKMIPVTEYFSPWKVNFRNANYVVADGVYYTFLFVPSDGYPTGIPAGWASILVNSCEGIDVDIFLRKQDTNTMIDKIGRRIRWGNTKIQDMNSTTTDFDRLNSSIYSGYYLKNGLSGNCQDIYYVSTLITITGKSYKEMNDKRVSLIDFLKTNEVQLTPCTFTQEEAYKSYLPLAKLSGSIYKRSKQNILTEGVGALYPFTSYEMSDEDGILLGQNEDNDSLVFADIFNTVNYKNANISILGTSGAGKTYLLQLIAGRFRRKHIPVYIIAPDKGHEFARFCENIGGQFITLSPVSRQCINVMEIRKKDDAASKVLDGSITEQSELADKIQNLHIFFKLLIPDISAEEDQLLDEALINVYKNKGITHDNSTLYDPSDPTKYREMPILGDVYEKLYTNPDSRRIANIMNRLVHGSASSFNQQTNVDLDNPYTVIDISKLTGELLLAGMFIATDWAYSKAKENRTKKKVIIIDEVWELIGSKSNVKAAEYVLEIFKIIRGYGGSAICATQDLNDFFALEDGKYGKGIINNSKTKIVLNLENKEAKSVKELLDLSQNEYKKILKFGRGHGLISTNGNNVPVHFIASELENKLITTDRKELEQIVNEKNTNQAS